MLSPRRLRSKRVFFILTSAILVIIILECCLNFPVEIPKGSRLIKSSPLNSGNALYVAEKFDNGEANSGMGKFPRYKPGDSNNHVKFYSAGLKKDSFLPFRVVHLDLKGAPPRLSFLKALFPLISLSGANALLIEYEDMFPYEGSLRNISARNAYTKAEVLDLLQSAESSGLEVIPLVQTFGHLEFVLKLEEFKFLRELPSFPQELCPSRKESLEVLVYEMIRQVAALHASTKRIHIGCDEVYHLAACAACSATRKTPRQIFADHVSTVARHVRKNYPNVRPLIWDDMFRTWLPQDIINSDLGEVVDLVVWVYGSDISHLVHPYIWSVYSDTFRNVWVASAFKGAFGATAVAPNIRRHYDNTIAWLQVLRNNPKPVQGIILTGWSRYDHFASLCELLPVSVPSLVLNLLAVSAGNHSHDDQVFREWVRLISCPKRSINITLKALKENEYQWEVSSCDFPGSNLFTAIGQFVAFRQRVNYIYDDLTQRQGWMSEYHVKHNFSSPFRVLESFLSPDMKGEVLLRELKRFQNSTQTIMTQYFDPHTVKEWIEQNTAPLIRKMEYLKAASLSFLEKDTWPRRPLD